jgi:hypothetical protein
MIARKGIPGKKKHLLQEAANMGVCLFESRVGVEKEAMPSIYISFSQPRNLSA